MGHFKRIKYFGFTAIMLFHLVLPSAIAESDFQSWQWVVMHLHQGERFKSHLYADNRLADNSGRERLNIIGPRLRYALSDHFQIGGGYLFLNIHNLNEDTWYKEHRFENELNFKLKFRDRWKFHHRNRFEWRLRESKTGWSLRTRSRVELRYQLHFGRLKSVYANNEVFWDHDINELNENRVVPVGLQFELGRRCDLNIFYMIQSIRRFNPSNWTQNHILGTHLNIRF